MAKYLVGFILGVIVMAAAQGGMFGHDVSRMVDDATRHAIDAITPKPSRPEIEWRLTL